MGDREKQPSSHKESRSNNGKSAEDNSASVLAQHRKSQAEISRQEILNQIFGNVGDLMDDFSCAVESTVLLHGRLYITDKFACFYSNLFGLEKKIRIPYTHITVVTKENTALIIPNAIAISTFKKQYMFRSFWDRDHCFFMLKSFISKHSSSKNVVNKDIEHIQHAHYSIKTKLDPLFDDGYKPQDDISSSNITAHDADYDDDCNSSDVNTASDAGGDHDGESDREEDEKIEEITMFRARSKDGAGKAVLVSTEEDYEAEAEQRKLKISILKDSLPLSVADFHLLFVQDSAVHSWLRYHELCNDEQLSCTQWDKMSTVEHSADMGMTREIKFLKPVNLPGLKSTKGVKVQRLQRFDSHGLIISSSTRLEDVPSADAFSVEDVICVKRKDDKSVNIEIYFEVKFIKSSWIRYMIETNTAAEMTKWLHSFFEYLRTSAKAKLEDRHVKLNSIKKVLQPVVDNADSDSEDGNKHSAPVKALVIVKKSLKKVATLTKLHVDDSVESWQRVEGRRFFVLCFAVIFGTALAVYIKIRTMSIHVDLLEHQIEDLHKKIDILLTRRTSLL
jgi:hypothetical protein